MIYKSKEDDMSQLTKHGLGTLGSCFVVFILAFSSLRGWAVLNLDIPAHSVYGFSSLLILLLALYGFNCRYRFNGMRSSYLRSLFLINALFGGYYLLGTLLLGSVPDISIFYIYLLPYIVFVFLRVDPSKLQLAIFFILLGISFSVIENYISLVSGGSLSYMEEYNRKLRPMVFESLSHTNGYIRLGGYTGSYHDSANILGIIGTYYFISSIVTRKLYYGVLAMLAFFAIMLTQSAANIVLALLTSLVFAIPLWLKFKAKITILFIVIFFMSALLVLAFPDLLVFTQRISPEGDWDGMKNKLTLDVMWKSFSFWFGHGNALGDDYAASEVAFLKCILEMGIIPACLLFYILIYPVYLFLRLKVDSFQLTPYVAALAFGFVSLAHYGSLFRITSIALFYTFYALFFQKLNSYQGAVVKK